MPMLANICSYYTSKSMITPEQIIKLVDTIQVIGRKTPNVNLIKEYYSEIFVRNHILYKTAKRRDYKNSNCAPCIEAQLDALRSYVGYPPLKKQLSKNITESRRNICYSCKYYVPLTNTCGTLILGGKTDEGEKLCGCNIWAKTLFKNQECPIKLWEKLTKTT